MPAGTGLVSSTTDVLHIVAYGLTIAGVTALVLLALVRPRRLVLIGLGGVAVVGVVGGSLLANPPAPEFGNAVGVFGNVVAPDDVDRYVITAKPGELYGLTFEITNHGSLPLRILGVYEPCCYAPPPFPDWQLASYVKYAGGGMFLVDDSKAIEPFDLQPGEFAQLFLTGRAGACALGADEPSVAYASADEYTIVYSLLGLESSTVIQPPHGEIVEPLRNDCHTL
jgi:hypothetical protein